jgi:excisionase family DNA binding protein
MSNAKPAEPRGSNPTRTEDRSDRQTSIAHRELDWARIRGAGTRDTEESHRDVTAATGAARTAGRTSPRVSVELDNVRRTISADQSGRRHVLLTTEVAAEYLAVSVRTIKNLLCDGKLPYVKVGRATRIDTADIDEYIERNRRRNRRPAREIK